MNEGVIGMRFCIFVGGGVRVVGILIFIFYIGFVSWGCMFRKG